MQSLELNSLANTDSKVLPRRWRDDMPPADSSSMVAKIVADLRPSADGSAVRTSLVTSGGYWLHCRQPACL